VAFEKRISLLVPARNLPCSREDWCVKKVCGGTERGWGDVCVCVCVCECVRVWLRKKKREEESLSELNNKLMYNLTWAAAL